MIAAFLALALAESCIAEVAEVQASARGLRVVPGTPWLEWRGRPVLLVGDSLTQGWFELGRSFDQEAYLDSLARRGINATLLWAYIAIVDQPRDERIGHDAPELAPWPRAEGRFDLTRHVPAYFDRLRAFARRADERGIVVILTVHDGWTKTRFAGHPFHAVNGGWLHDKADYVALDQTPGELPERFDPAWPDQRKHQYALERFCDRLIAATGGLGNVAYEMFNEGEWYDRARWEAFQRHFLAFFRRRTRQPLLVNDDRRHGQAFRAEPLADVVSRHVPRWDDRPPARVFFDHDARRFGIPPVKPGLFTEPVPEYRGGEAEREGLIRLIWGTALAGTGVLVQNDTSWGFDPRSRMASRVAERDAILDIEGHAARFLQRVGLPLGQMRPSGPIASSGICLAAEGLAYVAYAEDGSEPLVLDLARAGGGRFETRWYDPRAGQWHDAEPVAAGGVVRLLRGREGPAVVRLLRER